MRKNILISFLLIQASVMFGQITFRSNNQLIVEDCVKIGLFISKQSYQVCDKKSGYIYGLHGNKEFGIQYTIGVKVPNGFVLVDQAVRPWIYDDNFKKYEEEYDPLFYEANYSDIKEDLKYDSLDYSLTKQEILIDTTIYRFTSKSFNNEGFALDNRAGEKEGWIVLIKSNQDSDFDGAGGLDFIIYRKEITIEGGCQLYDLNRDTSDENILGGIFVVPSVTKIGIIEFRLCGILTCQNDQWKIACPFVGLKDSLANIGKNDEGTNDDADPSELTPVSKRDTKDAKVKKKNKK